MPTDKRVIIKLAMVGVLGMIAVALFLLYRNTFSREAEMKQVEERWRRLQDIPLPAGARLMADGADGGARYYGIDCHRTLVLDITGMSRAAGIESAAEQLRRHFIQFLQSWHDDLRTSGQSGAFTTVLGENAGVYLKLDIFWYGEAQNKTYKGPGAAQALAAHKPAAGRGRRFAAVSMLIFTR